MPKLGASALQHPDAAFVSFGSFTSFPPSWRVPFIPSADVRPMARVHKYTPAPSSAGSIAPTPSPGSGWHESRSISSSRQAGAQKRIGDALPKQVQAVTETGRELLKVAKRLGVERADARTPRIALKLEAFCRRIGLTS